MHGFVRGLSCKPNIYVSWSTSEHRVRLARRETGFSPPVKYLYWPFQGGTTFVDHLCYPCLVFVMLSSLFNAALWSYAGKGPTSCLWCFIVFCHFPMWYSLSGVVLDCIKSWSLSSFFLFRRLNVAFGYLFFDNKEEKRRYVYAKFYSKSIVTCLTYII